jgi:hypothetical protein
MELAVVVRQLMERSLAAAVREETWSFADHALVETLVTVVLSRLPSQQEELGSPTRMPLEQHD